MCLLLHRSESIVKSMYFQQDCSVKVMQGLQFHLDLFMFFPVNTPKSILKQFPNSSNQANERLKNNSEKNYDEMDSEV